MVLLIVALAACAQLEELNAPRLEPEPVTPTEEANATLTPFYLVATPTPAPNPVAVPTPVTPLLAAGTPSPTAAPTTQPMATDAPTTTPGPPIHHQHSQPPLPTLAPATPAPQATGVKRMVYDWRENCYLD